jgi:hypothetical protein
MMNLVSSLGECLSSELAETSRTPARENDVLMNLNISARANARDPTLEEQTR